MTTNGHNGQVCECGGCRASRAGLGPGPYTPDEWALIGAGVYVTVAPDPVPEHVAKARRKFDKPIADAEAAVEARLEVYDAATEHLSATRRHLHELLHAEFAWDPAVGPVVPADHAQDVRAARAAAEQAEADYLDASESLRRDRAKLTTLVKRRETAGLAAAYHGPQSVLAKIRDNLTSARPTRA